MDCDVDQLLSCDITHVESIRATLLGDARAWLYLTPAEGSDSKVLEKISRRHRSVASVDGIEVRDGVCTIP